MRNATLTPSGTPAGYCPVPGLKAPKTPLAKMSLTKPTGSVVDPVQSASVLSVLQPGPAEQLRTFASKLGLRMVIVSASTAFAAQSKIAAGTSRQIFI